MESKDAAGKGGKRKGLMRIESRGRLERRGKGKGILRHIKREREVVLGRALELFTSFRGRLDRGRGAVGRVG